LRGDLEKESSKYWQHRIAIPREEIKRKKAKEGGEIRGASTRKKKGKKIGIRGTTEVLRSRGQNVQISLSTTKKGKKGKEGLQHWGGG